MAKKQEKEPKDEAQSIDKPIPMTETEEKLSARDQQEVKVIERVIENRNIAPHDAFGRLTRNQIELIKRTVAKGASDDELQLFIQVCKGANLNPFLRQAHFVPFWDSKEGCERRAILIGIDGFRSIAESSGAYCGNDDPIYEGSEDVEVEVWEGKAGSRKKTGIKKIPVPSRSTVTVWKIVQGVRYAFTATARWSEYYPGGKKGGQWHDKPYLMLGKCAEALALRKAFPKLLSGMYVQEEMDRSIVTNTDDHKAQTGFNTLLNALGRASLKELNEYKEKMQKSSKYTDEQKEQYFEAIDKRIAELEKKETPKKNIKDDDIPIINTDSE